MSGPPHFLHELFFLALATLAPEGLLYRIYTGRGSHPKRHHGAMLAAALGMQMFFVAIVPSVILRDLGPPPSFALLLFGVLVAPVLALLWDSSRLQPGFTANHGFYDRGLVRWSAYIAYLLGRYFLGR